MSNFTFDSLFNFVAGLGTAKDKSTSSRYVINQLSVEQLSTAYRSDWVARKVVTAPAQDATREWRAWQADEDQITLLEKTERDLDIQRKLFRALVKARLYGGAALIMGIDGAGEPDEELKLERVKEGSLKYVHVLTRHEIAIGSMITDVMSDLYGEPEYYTVSSLSLPALKIHPSRVIRLLGAEIPMLSESDGWSDSCLQAVDDAIKNVGLCSGGIAAMVWEAKVDIIKIPNLMESMATAEYQRTLIERFTLANTAKSMVNALLLDKEEEWTRMQQSFSGMPEILQEYLHIASGAADIPATRLLGQSPKGLNATGQSDTRNYYDMVRSTQKTELTPTLSRLDEVLIRSALGDRPEEVHYEWRPLWQMNETEKAALAYQKAQAHKIDVDNSLILEDALAQGRINQLIEDGFYPGFEQAIEEAKKAAAADLDETDPQVIAQNKALRGVEAANPALTPPPVPGATPGSQPGAPQNPSLSKPPAATDSQPRSLYVRRDVVNSADIKSWARAQGFEVSVPEDEMHVTVIYSRTPVDWIKVGEDHPIYSENAPEGGMYVAPGGPRLVEQFGGGAVVLQFSSWKLYYRHCAMREAGCSFDYVEYQPHITISYDLQGLDLTQIEPYRGEIVLGPEIFEEINDNNKIGLSEDGGPGSGPRPGGHNADQPRNEKGKFGSSGGEHGKSSPLNLNELVQVGGQMGSNPAGVFQGPTGDKFYVKTSQSVEHARNEYIAADLYKAAGAPTMTYRDVEGGKHVATEMAPLDKNNSRQFSEEENRQARENFAVHAWTANWDAAGLGYDNQVVSQGQVRTVDVGGALAYRAQGGLKGDKFGNEAREWDSMRDKNMNPENAKMFGNMTSQELKQSAQKVANIHSDVIKSTIEKRGGSAQLAQKMIERRNYIAKRAGIHTADGGPGSGPQGGGFFSKLFGGAHPNLSSEEKSAVKDYTKDGYKALNNGLRKDTLTPDQAKNVATINNALDKMPPHQGEVFRTAVLTGKQFESYMNARGQTVSEKGFTSTSQDTFRAIKENVTGQLYGFRIQSNGAGRDVSALSKNKEEKEVLFKSGTQFKITKIIGREIQMEAVSHTTKDGGPGSGPNPGSGGNEDKEHKGILKSAKDFLTTEGAKAAIKLAATKIAENKHEIVASAVLAGVALMKANLPPDVSDQLFEIVTEMSKNAGVNFGVAKQQLRNTVDKLITLRRIAKDGEIIVVDVNGVYRIIDGGPGSGPHPGSGSILTTKSVEESLGKPEFNVLIQKLESENKEVINKIAHEIVGLRMSASKNEALQKIKNMHNALVSMQAKRKFMAGRSAG